MAYGIGAQSAQYVGDAGVTPRSLAVPAAINEMDNELYRLEELTGQLLTRIMPLVAPQGGSTDVPKPGPAACEFASILGGKADRIRTVADRIYASLMSLEF